MAQQDACALHQQAAPLALRRCGQHAPVDVCQRAGVERDAARCCARFGGCRLGDAGRRQRQCVAGAQHQLARGAEPQGVGLHQAALVDDGPVHVHLATVGDEPAQVEHFTGRHLHTHGQVGQAGVHQVHAAGRRQAHAAAGRGDAAGVLHLAAQQQDLAAKAALQFAFIAHPGGAAGVGREAVAAGKKVVVVQTQRAGHQAGHVHTGALPKEHTVRVQQPHLAVAGQLAQDLAGVVAGDAVEHLAGRTGLVKVNTRAGADGKTLPVEDGAGCVAHRQLRALRGQLRLAADDLQATRQCHRGGLRKRRQRGQHRAAQQAGAHQRTGQAVQARRPARLADEGVCK